MPDSAPNGPFASQAEALADAQDGYDDDEACTDHDHPDDNGEGRACTYLGAGLWDCGVTDQH